MDRETSEPTPQAQAEKAGGFSTAFGIIGFLFVAVPILGLAAVVFGILSIRASRKVDAPVTWTSLIGLLLGTFQLCLAGWMYWILLTGQIRFH